MLDRESLAESIAAADRAQAEIFARLGRQALGGRSASTPHGALFSTRIPSRTLNGLFLTGLPVEPQRALDEMLGFCSENGVPWSLVARDELIASMSERIEAAELREFDADEGMVLDSIPEAAPPLPEGLVIDCVDDLAGIRTCLLTMLRGYQVPPAVFAPLLRAKSVAAYLAEPPMTFFVGYLGGAPVAASIGIAWEKVSYVFMVSTLPGFRRRGIGEAMTWRVALEGRERGCRASFLRATELGRPVYRRMGYRPVNRYPAFTRPLVRGRKKIALILRFLWWKAWFAVAGPEARNRGSGPR